MIPAKHSRLRPRTNTPLACLLGLIAVFFSGWVPSACAQQSNDAIVVGNIDTGPLGYPSPAGLAFSNAAETFLVLETPSTPPASSSDIIVLSDIGELSGIVTITSSVEDPVNMTFDNQGNRLLIFQPGSQELVEISADAFGVLDPGTLTSIDASQFGLINPQGMTVDPANGHLFMLDAVGPRIVRIEPDPSQGFSQPTISEINLAGNGLVDVQGIAFDPTNGNFHILNPTGELLYEVTDVGQVVLSRDVSGLGFIDPQGMVFAQSGDFTPLMKLRLFRAGNPTLSQTCLR